MNFAFEWDLVVLVFGLDDEVVVGGRLMVTEEVPVALGDPVDELDDEEVEEEVVGGGCGRGWWWFWGCGQMTEATL